MKNAQFCYNISSMENEEEKIIESEKEKMSPKEKKYTIIILSVLSLVLLGSITFPIVGAFANQISPSKKGSPSFAWDNQRAGTYDSNKTYRTSENVFLLFEDDEALSLSLINVSENDAYLVMPTSIINEDKTSTSITSIVAKGTNIFSPTSVNVLKGIYFPSLYTNVGDNVFSNLVTLEEIKFGSGNGIQKLGNHVFKGDSSLMNITFSRNLKTLGEGAFEDVSSIKKIDLSETSLETIEQEAFKNCSSLKSLTLPRSISSIPSHMIDGCSSLESITYQGNIRAWNALTKDASWKENSNIKQIVCSDGIISL